MTDKPPGDASGHGVGEPAHPERPDQQHAAPPNPPSPWAGPTGSYGGGYNAEQASGDTQEQPGYRQPKHSAYPPSSGPYISPAASGASYGAHAAPQYAEPQYGQRTEPQHGESHYGEPRYGEHHYAQTTQQRPVGPIDPPERRKGTASLVAGIAVLALLAGGAAGGVGAYIVAENETNAAISAGPNALNAAPPANQTSNAPQGSVESVAQKVLPSVVELQVRSQTSAGEGSGIVFGSNGLILTNNHVVEGIKQGGQVVAKFQNGKSAPVTVVGTDPTSDLAVVKADGVSGLQTADFGRSDSLRVGQQVVAVGSPYELAGTVTSGIISALHRPTRAGGENGGEETVMDAIQTDAAINPGNSGGPLVNMSGQVIGINSAIYSPPSSGGFGGAGQQAGNVGIGFAIPVDQARRVGNQLVRSGSAIQAKLDVTVTDSPASDGARIVQVSPGGPAAKAGLRAGSVVVRADNRLIDSADALIALIHAHQPGDTVTLTLQGGETKSVTLAGEKVGGR